MRKGITLIELVLSLTVGMLVFEMLFSGNVEVTRAIHSAFQEANHTVGRANLQSWIYRKASSATASFSNRYLGQQNRGFCSWQNALAQPQTLYLHSKGSYRDFAEANFSDVEPYQLVYYEGKLNHGTYGQGVVLSDKIVLVSGKKLFSYAKGKVSFVGRVSGSTLNMSVRVKN